MSHKITVKHNLSLNVDGTWRLQCWVSETENMTNKIFVYQHKPDMPYETSDRNVFVNIAQPSDIAEYPEDTVGATFPFFRRAYIDITIKDTALVYNTLEGIKQDVSELCKALDRIE
jgi:hypothetical protein